MTHPPSIAQQINAQASAVNTPLSVLLELTWHCNHTCYYCYHQADAPGADLTTAEWTHILDQLTDAGTLYLTLSGGEPFMRKDLPGIIAHARTRNFAVSVISNGSFITAGMARRLKTLAIMDIGISVHALDQALHDRLAEIRGSHGRALNALAVCKAAGIRTIVKHTVSSANFTEFERLRRWCETEGHLFECDALVMPHHPGVMSPYALSNEQFRTFAASMQVRRDPAACIDTTGANLHCDAGRSVAGIQPDGTVVPCIMLPIPFGNMLVTPFKEIWNGAIARQFRIDELHVSRQCTGCELRESCSRCPGIALAETGQWQGAAPSLCRYGYAMKSGEGGDRRSDGVLE